MKSPGSNATVFVWLYSVASIWHFTSSSNEIEWFWRHLDPVHTPLVTVAIVTAFIAACYPNNARAFIFMIAAQAVVIYVRLPFAPTHLVMELFFAASVLTAFVLLALAKQEPLNDIHSFYASFNHAGKILLLVMYFFGTFHKLNPGYLSLHSSCVVDFMRGLPVPSTLIAADWFNYFAIYAVLVIEFIAMLLLLSRRTKYFGMLIGIPFHIVIGVSSYGTLAHFSAFALALHALFLPEGFAARVQADPWVPRFLKRLTTFQCLTVVLVLLQVWFANLNFAAGTNSTFALFAFGQYVLTVRHGRHLSEDPPLQIFSPLKPVNVLPAIFFIHCCGPYLGLSTEGAVQMFSGLRTEGGVSNHYIVQKPLYLFPYQRDVVDIVYSNDLYLTSLNRRRQGLTLTDFNRFLGTRTERLELPLILRINDERVPLFNAEDVHAFEQRYVFPLNHFEYKFLIFRDVDESEPNACRH